MPTPETRKLPPLPFLTTRNSPFPDGYDIEAEGRVLKDLIEADDPDATDPRYLRLVEYYERQSQLDQKKVEYQDRNAAEPLVSSAEGKGTAKLGAFVSSEPNTVTIHTKEAYRLFTGRAKDPVPGRSIPPILGARTAGSMLRSLWLLSGNDNPYADWALIDIHGRITDQIEKLRAVNTDMEQQTKALRQRGINVSVVSAREPQTVPLGFASPYAFLLVEMLAEFDYFIRCVRTLEGISRIGSDEAKKKVAVEVTALRGMFELIQKYERVLTREKLNELVRADWLPGATAAQVQRVQAMIAVFGLVPREVFTGEISPRHTRRDMRMSAETLQVLSHLELNPKMPKKQGATGAAGTAEVVVAGTESEATGEATAPIKARTADADAEALISSKDVLPGLPNRKARRETKKADAIAEAVASQAISAPASE
ncbi:MAG: TIGR03761 family integrating conjugative element protein [Betaproteobacteria bacterium]|nr:MAG: TIGR03761 family integrating conjugative element protein [Betaproteobacteria bacterium]